MCPPKPEALIYAIRKLQEKVKKESIITRKEFLDSHFSHLYENNGILEVKGELR